MFAFSFQGTTIKCWLLGKAFGKCFHIQIKKASAKKREGEGLLFRLEALLEKKSDLFDTLSMHGFDNVSLF